MSTTTHPITQPPSPLDPATAVPAPRGLLLDFGGVVMTTRARPGWAEDLAAILVERGRRCGAHLERGAVEDSLHAGREALALWKNAASRRQAPRELSHREVVEDFLLADLPDPVRAAFSLEAEPLLTTMATLVADHDVREGVPELLALCRDRGIPLAIVSNAHAGRAHREILDRAGLAGFFGVQLYSDELGIRKPHPGMIARGAEALGLAAEQTWYVGDTWDRDVVAGRRAGVGAVVITRDSRTAHPPFPVSAAPDLVLDSPAGLIDPLRAVLERPVLAPRTVPAPTTRPPRPALLLDHGGVLTTSVANPERDREMARHLVALAERTGHPLGQDAAERAVARGWDLHRDRKRRRDATDDVAARHAEIAPEELWGDLVGADLPEPLRAALRIEARELSLHLHRLKSAPTPRPGAIELVRWCREHGIVVGIVSNTISGRGVREILERYGIAEDIGPAVYSDELGIRKPGGEIFAAALAALETDPADVVYVGDTVLNDGRGGRRAGIGTVCLLSGGKDSDPLLHEALAEGVADHVLDGPAALIALLADRLGPAPD